MSSIWTIRRSTSDAKLAGLCGGIAKHWGVDPVLVRVAFALLALSAGMGVVLYLAGWLLLPVEGKDKAPVDDLFGEAARKWPKEVWIAVVTLACVAMFAIFGSISPFSIGPAVVIAVIWYFGFYKPRQAKRTDAARAGAAGIAQRPRPAAVHALSGTGHPVHRSGRGLAAADRGERAADGPIARLSARTPGRCRLRRTSPGRSPGPPTRCLPMAPQVPDGPDAPDGPASIRRPGTGAVLRVRARRLPGHPGPGRSLRRSAAGRSGRPGQDVADPLGPTAAAHHPDPGRADHVRARRRRIPGRLDPARGLLRLRPAGGRHRADPGHLVRTGSRSARLWVCCSVWRR